VQFIDRTHNFLNILFKTVITWVQCRWHSGSSFHGNWNGNVSVQEDFL
jgi:hypothetical protein